jgi:hypothetical protein
MGRASDAAPAALTANQLRPQEKLMDTIWTLLKIKKAFTLLFFWRVA